MDQWAEDAARDGLAIFAAMLRHDDLAVRVLWRNADPACVLMASMALLADLLEENGHDPAEWVVWQLAERRERAGQR